MDMGGGGVISMIQYYSSYFTLVQLTSLKIACRGLKENRNLEDVSHQRSFTPSLILIIPVHSSIEKEFIYSDIYELFELQTVRKERVKQNKKSPDLCRPIAIVIQ